MGLLHMIGGLPRSGSTLLSNILAQNPQFRVSDTSGMVETLLLIRNGWDRIREHQASSASDVRRRGVLGAAFRAYHFHEEQDERIVFDKSRSWLGHLEMAEELLERPVKVLVPVRDIRDVLASTEMLWRKTSALQQFPWERTDYAAYQSLPGRLKKWMEDTGIVGSAYNRVRDAFLRGFASRMMLVPYDCLTKFPRTTLLQIYDFLGAEPFEHNFEHVKQVTTEDDRIHGIPGLHRIRSKVEWKPSRWAEILGEYGAAYGHLNPVLGYPV